MAAPEWLKDAIFYQIFPERFASGDSSLTPPDAEPWDAAPTRDNFLGGDLQGIIDHLDHIQSLGVNALYLTPIFEARTNHRYDAVDYFRIDHRLGDLASFQRLLDACHHRGIRVVLDGVFNHCGNGHGAFQDVVANEASSPYVNWFFTEDFPVRAEPEPNYQTCSGCYYLPKWNTYNPEVRAHHLRVARHWIEQGIDGWRLDVPYFVPTSFWRQFRDCVKSIDSDLYIVAEEWRDPEEWLRGDTADGTMNYSLRDLILGFTADRTRDAQQTAEGLRRLNSRIPVDYRHGMLNLLGSHDTERVRTRHQGNDGATLLAFTLTFACQGSPMIYYGDEVGMTGDNDPGCRAGMEWDETRWSRGLIDGIRNLGRMRRSSEALRKGDQEVWALDPDTLMVERTLGEHTVLVIAHRGNGVILDPSAHPSLSKLTAEPIHITAHSSAILGAV